MKKFATVALLAIALVALAPNGASALPGKPDDVPCGEPRPETSVQTMVQVCELWRGDVPVYESKNPGFFTGENKVVGYLNSAQGNWFICQDIGAEFDLVGSNASNDWWAYTMADNGEMGWVPEVYFSGGGNFRQDAGLAICD